MLNFVNFSNCTDYFVNLDDGTDENLPRRSSDEEKLIYFFMFTFIKASIIVLLSAWPISKYIKLVREKRRLQEEIERRLVSEKSVESIRETYLIELMKGYSMVLSKSDLFDNNDSASEEGSCKELTIETCSESISSSSFDSEDPRSPNENIKYNLSDNNDIEMQRPRQKDNPAEKDDKNIGEVSDAKSYLECDSTVGYHRTICVPVPGQKYFDYADCKTNVSEYATTVPPATTAVASEKRDHSGECSICLTPYEVSQKVTWSSNPNCPHVFHHQCLLQWFVAVGKRAFKGETVSVTNDQDPDSIKKKLCNFEKPCPFCRQNYFLGESQEIEVDDSNNDSNSNNNNDDSIMASSLNTENEEEVVDIEQVASA